MDPRVHPPFQACCPTSLLSLGVQACSLLLHRGLRPNTGWGVWGRSRPKGGEKLACRSSQGTEQRAWANTGEEGRSTHMPAPPFPATMASLGPLVPHAGTGVTPPPAALGLGPLHPMVLPSALVMFWGEGQAGMEHVLPHPHFSSGAVPPAPSSYPAAPRLVPFPTPPVPPHLRRLWGGGGQWCWPRPPHIHLSFHCCHLSAPSKPCHHHGGVHTWGSRPMPSPDPASPQVGRERICSPHPSHLLPLRDWPALSTLLCHLGWGV